MPTCKVYVLKFVMLYEKFTYLRKLFVIIWDKYIKYRWKCNENNKINPANNLIDK